MNEQVAGELEDEAAKLGLPCAGRIPYDPAVTRAQVSRQAIVEASDGPAASAIRKIWDKLDHAMQTGVSGPGESLVQLQVESDPVSLNTTMHHQCSNRNH